MPMPTYQAIGTAVEGTGDVSPTWPTHAIFDVALLDVESAGGEAATLSVSAGFQQVPDSPQFALTGTSGTRITRFWCRATSTSMATPTVTDPGNHVAAVIHTYRGCIQTGNPWDVTAGNFKDVASTSDTLPAVTTTVIDCLVVLSATRNAGTAGGAWTGTYINTGMSSLTSRLNGSYASGNGGGILILNGGKATAGSSGVVSATLGASQTCAYHTIALRPPRQGGAITGSASASTSNTGLKAAVGTVIGSASAATSNTGRKVAVGNVTGSAAASTSNLGRKVGVGAVTGSAAVSTSVTGARVRRGAITGSAAASTTVVGHHGRGGAITGSAAASTGIVGRKVGRGSIIGLANADTTVVGKKVPRPIGYEDERNVPGVVWRLGKIGGGDDYRAILMFVVDWAFEASFEPEPLGGTFTYPAYVPGPEGTEVKTSDYLYPGAEICCILGGEERPNLRFTVHDPVDELLRDEDGHTIAHNIKWTILNMFHRMGSTTIHPDEDAVVLRPKEWPGVLAGQPAQFVVHQAHTDDALDEIGFDFDELVDSLGAPYNKTVDLKVDRLAVTGIGILRTLWDLKALDMRFERRKFRVFNPDSNSQNYAGTGTGTKIMISGRDLLGAPRTIQTRDTATRVWVRGDEDRFGTAQVEPGDFTALDLHTGYREIIRDAASIKDPAILDQIAADYLEIYKQPRRQLTYAINVGWGKDPLIHYQMGDWILKRDGSEEDGLPEKVRVLRCYYKGDQNGVTACGITVSDWLGDLETRTQRKIEGIIGGLPGSARPSRNAVPPEAPTNLRVTWTLIPPASGSGGKNWYQANLTWDWSGLDLDGPVCGDFDKFVIRWKYGNKGWETLDGTDAMVDEIPRVDPGKELTIQVGAQDQSGNTSWSADAVQG